MVRSPPFSAGLGTGFASEEKSISPLPAISPLQRPGGDAFSFEDILDMGISSLGIWDLAKSQAHPGASLPVQLEPCCPVSFNSMSLSPGRWLCLHQGVHIPALYLNTSHISWLVPGGILWIQLSLGKSFPLCGQLTDVLAFLITCLLLAACNTHPAAAWAVACLSEVSLWLCILVTGHALS